MGKRISDSNSVTETVNGNGLFYPKFGWDVETSRATHTEGCEKFCCLQNCGIRGAQCSPRQQI